jgi:hypothetical protein
MKEKINTIRQLWADNLLAGNMLQGGNVLPAQTVLVARKNGEALLTLRDLLVIGEQLPDNNNDDTNSSRVDAPHMDTSKPDLGVSCVVWFNGDPRVDFLTDENHHSPYWADSEENYGEEDRFMVLPE